MKHSKTEIRIISLLLALLLLFSGCQEIGPAVTNPTGTVPDGYCVHTDDNTDELCDNCGIDVTVTLDFYGINDLHGVFCDSRTSSGVDEWTTYLKNAKADDKAYEILISSGDMWQGSVESSSNHGALMTEWMNEVGFDAMTLGNHEYDWGSSYFPINDALAEFPFLGINITDSNVEEDYTQPSVVVERGGVRIGIIGAIGNCKSSISGEFQGGLDFAVKNQLTALVKAEATRLRTEEYCDFIVYSLHDGSSEYSSTPISVKGDLKDSDGSVYYDVDLSDGYVDLVLEGHSHHAYILKDDHGVYHLQAGGNGSAMSYISVDYNLVTRSYEVETVKLLSPGVYANPSLADDPIVDELIDKYFPDGDPYLDTIGENSQFRNADELRNILATLYWETGKETWGSEYDVVLGGGFMSCRGKGLYAGTVTYDQLYSLFPFDNDLVLGSISGKKLKAKFLNSSSYNYFCDYDPSLYSSIQDNQTYYILTDTYTSTYAPNGITEIDRIKGIYARDLLRDYIAAGNMQ